MFCHLVLLVWFSIVNAQIKLIEQPTPSTNLSKPKIYARIVGGELTTNARLGGYIVALRYRGDFTCGGTLVSEWIVVTAQHCFLGRKQLNQWTAHGGVTFLDETGYMVEIENLMKAASFRQDDLHMDVAVLKLSKPMIAPNIRPVSLCERNWAMGDQMTVSGWGLITAQGTAPHNQLRTVTLPVVPRSMCRMVYQNVVNLTNSMFCVGVPGERDACTYDSGGPLIFKNQLCGIVSFGVGCADRYPGVYTNINYVKPFIRKSIQLLLKKK